MEPFTDDVDHRSSIYTESQLNAQKAKPYSFQSDLEKSSEYWLTKGQSILSDLLTRQTNNNRAKNVISNEIVGVAGFRTKVNVVGVYSVPRGRHELADRRCHSRLYGQRRSQLIVRRVPSLGLCQDVLC